MFQIRKGFLWPARPFTHTESMYIYIYIIPVGGIPTPLKNTSSSHHQPVYIRMKLVFLILPPGHRVEPSLPLHIWESMSSPFLISYHISHKIDVSSQNKIPAGSSEQLRVLEKNHLEMIYLQKKTKMLQVCENLPDLIGVALVILNSGHHVEHRPATLLHRSTLPVHLRSSGES